MRFQMYSQRCNLPQEVARYDSPLLKPVMSLKQVAYVLMSERQAPMVVLVKEPKIILQRGIALSTLINHCVEDNQMGCFHLGSKFTAASLPLELIFQNECVKEKFP